MRLSIKLQKLSRAFKKHHIHGLPFAASFNEFTAPDTGDPHDHPFDFITHILSGGYTERIYSVHASGDVTTVEIERKPGTSHLVKATDIHQIIDVPTGHCVTMMLPQNDYSRAPHFWRFIDGKAYHRAWNKRKFLPAN